MTAEKENRKEQVVPLPDVLAALQYEIEKLFIKHHIYEPELNEIFERLKSKWREAMKKEIRVFEANTARQAIKDMLEAGFMPMSLKETYDYREKTKDSRWFGTRTLCLRGEIKTATRKQLENIKNIDEIYEKGGRLLFVGGSHYGYRYGNGGLNCIGRFVGVRRSKGGVR